MEEKKIVQIKVTIATKDKLKARGRKGDSYEAVITKMFEELEGDTVEELEGDIILKNQSEKLDASMSISPDKTTVRFIVGSKKIFETMQTGAPPHFACLLNDHEYRSLREAKPKKIIIQYQQKFCLGTIESIIYGKTIVELTPVIFEWQPEKTGAHP